MLLNFIIFFNSISAAENADQDCDPKSLEKTNLWEINTKPPPYLFGTIHLPYTLVWDEVSENAKKAIQSSKKLFTELDFTDPDLKEKLSNCQLLPEGKDLSSILPPSILKRLEKFFDWVEERFEDWLPDEKKADHEELFDDLVKDWRITRPVWLKKESISKKNELELNLSLFCLQNTLLFNSELTFSRRDKVAQLTRAQERHRYLSLTCAWRY